MTNPFNFPIPEPATATASLRLHLKIASPVLGGAVRARTTDEVDYIRAQSIRGQLRFWWRATTRDAASAAELYNREKALWGGVFQPDRTGEGTTQVVKSKVRVLVHDVIPSEVMTNEVALSDPDAYALWPSRGQAGRGIPPASRRAPGLQFQLSIAFPKQQEAEVRRAVSAWLCFGGYGSRTRRGLGKVAPACDVSKQLVPASATSDELSALLGSQLFSGTATPTDWPRLVGVALAVGTPGDPTSWHTSLRWLREFRQGAPQAGPLGMYDKNFARVRGEGHRPSISNWPEADKVRQLTPGRWSHRPVHNATPVWPRASFGLPIIAQFQTRSRDNGRYDEPANFELRWVDRHGEEHDRLASPLLIGMIPLRNDQFVPFALWLNRAFPANARVIARQNNRMTVRSEAAFDQLVAAGEEARFQPLQIGQRAQSGLRMQTAFFQWLQSLPNKRPTVLK